jgi:hypothetical protein
VRHYGHSIISSNTMSRVSAMQLGAAKPHCGVVSHQPQAFAFGALKLIPRKSKHVVITKSGQYSGTSIEFDQDKSSKKFVTIINSMEVFMRREKKSNWLLVMMMAAWVFISCSKNPSGPASPAPNDEFVKVAATSGAQVFRSVQTIEQIEHALKGPDALGKMNVPAVGSLARSGARFSQALAPFHPHAGTIAAKAWQLHKAMDDTVLYDERWTDPITGIDYHLWVSYNTDTGKATVYIVATNHPNSSPLERDSTRIVVNVNFTLADTTDDVVELLENAKDYRAGYRLRYEEGRIVPDAYQPGTEPTGGVLEALSVHAPGQDTVEVRYRLEYHETTAGDQGSWSKTVSFRDGTRHGEDITFTSTNVIFNVSYRDGTREQGQFNVPDENHLSFNKTVTYPTGSDPRSLFESGEYARNPADSSATANFSREIFYANGASDRYAVAVKETRQNGFRRIEVTETNSDGTGGSWTLQEGPTKAELTGFRIDEARHYILFNGAFYHDGSGDLHLEVYASKEAFERGEPPIFTADLHFGPDGSGSGMITGKEGATRFAFGVNGSPSN